MFSRLWAWATTPRAVRLAQQKRRLESIARAKGFLMVSASPLTRSSYHADSDFAEMKKNRAAQFG